MSYSRSDVLSPLTFQSFHPFSRESTASIFWPDLQVGLAEMPDNDIRCLAFQIDSPAPVRFRFLKGRRRHPTKLNRLQHAEARAVRSRHREVEPSRPGMETLTAFSVLFSDFTDDVMLLKGPEPWKGF
jgi:hypothetical protein